jgi:hypothetical protein
MTRSDSEESQPCNFAVPNETHSRHKGIATQLYRVTIRLKDNTTKNLLSAREGRRKTFFWIQFLTFSH